MLCLEMLLKKTQAQHRTAVIQQAALSEAQATGIADHVCDSVWSLLLAIPAVTPKTWPVSTSF